jgi:hypothetical protein
MTNLNLNGSKEVEENRQKVSSMSVPELAAGYSSSWGFLSDKLAETACALCLVHQNGKYDAGACSALRLLADVGRKSQFGYDNSGQ